MRMVSGTLHHAAFRRLLAARVLSGFGSYMQVVASGWVVYQLSQSAMAVGVLGFLSLIPSLVGSPAGGWLADRFCPRKLATALSVLSAAGPAALAVLAFTDSLTVPLIYVFTVVGAIPHAVALPVKSIVTPYSVPKELRKTAVSDLSAANGIAELLGALTGGLLVSVVGPGPAYLVNAGSEVVNAALFHFSPVLQQSCDRARAMRSGGLLSGLAAGWQYVIVRIALLGSAAYFAVVAPIQSLMPKIAAAHNESAMTLGILLGAISVGALIGNQVVRRLIHQMQSATGMTVAALSISGLASLGLSVSPTIVSDVAFLIPVGFAWEMVFVAGTTSVQLEVPADIAGRMIGVYYLIIAVALALGALAVGWLFDTVGVDPSLLLIGAGSLLVALGLFVTARHARPVPCQDALAPSEPRIKNSSATGHR